MSATDYARQKIVNDLLGVTPYSPPAMYLALFTADPTETGSFANEVTGGGYARQPLAGAMSTADTTGNSVNTSAITYAAATTDWGTVTYLAICDALTTGNMICPGVPATPRTITIGQPFQIPVGKLRLRLT
jgi:hypothetical protein